MLLNQLYWVGVTDRDNLGINSYKIATLSFFISIFAPFWIAYSALLKIVLMQDRYEPSQVKKKGCCQKFLMMLFLTFLGPTILLTLSKIVLAIGEVVAVCFLLTCNKRLVSRIKSWFDSVGGYILIGIDKYTFDGINALQKNSLVFFQDIPMVVVQLFILVGVLECPELLEDSSTFYLSLLFTLMNMSSFIITKLFEKFATDEYFVMLCLEGMTANITWLPHVHKMRKTTTFNLHLNFGNLFANIPGFTSMFGAYFAVNFKFNDMTVRSLVNEIHQVEERERAAIALAKSGRVPD
jgi:hypothetical protein